MKHELREFFPKVLGIYHPDGAFDPDEIKAKCEQIKEDVVEGHDESVSYTHLTLPTNREV